MKSLLLLALYFMVNCASTDKKYTRPYKIKTYEPGFDFSGLKKNTRFYLNHVNGKYYKGNINLEKSGPGLLCLHQGTGTRCFIQKNIVEITEDTSESFQGNGLLINLAVLAVFLALIYYLPSR